MSRFRAWRRERAAERRQRKIRRAELALQDAVEYWVKWGFANLPSEDEAAKQRIYRLIRELERLGGDALETIPYSNEYLCAEAMPETFERVESSPSTHYWKTRRR